MQQPTASDAYRAALAKRLSLEWDDADLAASVAAGWDDDMISVFADVVAESDVFTSGLLDYHPARAPMASVDSLSTQVAGLNAVVPEGYLAPSTYDIDSAQPWTTNRRAYLGIDVPARLLTAKGTASS